MAEGKQTVYDFLEDIYTTPSEDGASYGSVYSLYQAAKKKGATNVTKDQVQKFLNTRDSYTKHRGYLKHFPMKKIIVGGPNQLHQADLIDFQQYAPQNGGVRFLLVVLDVFSKFLWVEPLKDKTNVSVLEALKKIYPNYKAFPSTFTSDKGTEFTGKKIQDFFKENFVTYYNSHGNTKAQFVERAIRSLKQKIFREMEGKESRRYIDSLPQLVNDINHTVSRVTGVSAADVSPENSKRIFFNEHGGTIHSLIAEIVPTESQKKNFGFQVGDYVRILADKGVFSKKYNDTFSTEIFQVTEVKMTNPIQAKLQDLLGEEILGKFYKSEMQLVWLPKLKILVERQIKTDKDKNVLVKWEGYGEKFNSWVPLSSLF